MASQIQTAEKLKLSDVFNEISTIKNIISEQRAYFNDSIDQIRHEIADKPQKCDSVVSSLKSEINNIKAVVSTEIYYSLQPTWKKTSVNEKIDYVFMGSCIEQIECEYESQISNG